MSVTAQGTAFSWTPDGGTAVTYCLTDISWSENGTELDVTTLCDTDTKKYEVGLLDLEVSITLDGVVETIEVGDEGAIAYTPQGGSAINLANAVCTSREFSAATDDKQTTTLTFKPAAA